MSILKGLFRDKKLEVELQELNEKYEFLKEAFAKLTSYRENLENEIKNYELLKEKFQKKEQEFKSLKLYFEKQQEELINLRVVKRDSERELENLKAEQESLNVELSKRQKLELENKEQKLKISNLEKKNEKESLEKNRLLKELSKSLSEEKELKEVLSKLKQELDDLKINKEREKSKIVKLEVNLESLKKDQELELSKRQKLELENKEQKLKISSLEEKNEKELKERLSKVKEGLEEKRKIKILYDQLISKIDELKKENKELKLKIDEQKEPKEEEQKIVEDLQIKIENFELEEKLDEFDCLNYSNYCKNKDDLNKYLLKFSEGDFRKILSLSREKNIFNVFEERQLLSIITWLKFNTPLEKLNIEKLKELYKKFMEKYHEKEVAKSPVLEMKKEAIKEKSILPKAQIEDRNKISLVGGWINYDNYLANKDDLVPLLKTFKESDFKEIFIEGKKRKIIKPSQERDFSNILTRLKLKLPITDMSLEKIEPFYELLMNDIHKKKLESSRNIEKIEVEESISKDEEDFFEIENYTAKDWYKLYELSKNDKNISEWLRKKIFTLGKYVENYSEINQSQYEVIKNNYGILYPLMKKIKTNTKVEAKEVKIEKINLNNEVNNEKLDNTELKVKLEKNIADILF